MEKNKEIPESMYPQNDFIFKRIFGYEGNEEITKDLVSNIIGQKIKILEFKNPYLLRELKNDKEETLDIKALLDNDILCDIEIQVGNFHDLEKRILDYWAKLYRTSIGKSKRYKNMKKTIVIFITTFDVDGLIQTEDYKTRWGIYEEKNKKLKLTDVFEVDIIELSKAKRQLKMNQFQEMKDLKDWIKFLINPQDLENENMEDLNEEIKRAYELWQDLSLTEEERDIMERKYLNLVAMQDAQEYERKLGREQGLEEGRKEGRKEGREEGREEGSRNKAIEIAKKMLEKNKDIAEIIEFTGLTQEEIENLK